MYDIPCGHDLLTNIRPGRARADRIKYNTYKREKIGRYARQTNIFDINRALCGFFDFISAITARASYFVIIY